MKTATKKLTLAQVKAREVCRDLENLFRKIERLNSREAKALREQLEAIYRQCCGGEENYDEAGIWHLAQTSVTEALRAELQSITGHKSAEWSGEL